MKSPLPYGLLYTCLAILISGAVATPQEPPDEVLKFNTDMVVLDVQVVEKKTGRIVGDLRREDFELSEDGVKQQITYFGRDQLPLSILLLLDISGSVQPIIEQIGQGALDALKRLKPEDEVAVMAFGTHPRLIQGFSKDRKLVSEKISEAANAHGLGKGTFFTDALYAAALEMPKASNPASRRSIIVVTDNVASSGTKKTIRRLTGELFESGTVVNGLIVRAAFGKVMNVMTFGLVRAVNPYSEATGGDVVEAERKDVSENLGEIFTRLRTRYTLGYKPTNTNEDGKFRTLKVQLAPAAQKDRALAVHTKRGYYFRKKKVVTVTVPL